MSTHDDPDLPMVQEAFTIKRAVRQRLLAGTWQPGDLAAFRQAFHDMSQARFAAALGISIDTVQNWEQGRTHPDGPAKALLRVLARHPGILLRELAVMG
jgi:putative transcriptional regulator